MAPGSYNHTQRSIFLLLAFTLNAAIFVAIAQSVAEPSWLKSLFYVLSLLLVACAALFHSLNVSVDHKALTWNFGFGFWPKSILRSDIVEADAVKTKWWNGWGIRWTPDDWLYNIWGFDAVAVTTHQGKTVLIGTDEPEALVAALKS